MALIVASADKLDNKHSPSDVALDSWTKCVVDQARTASCITVGLMSASRDASDRRVVDRLAKSLACALRDTDLDPRMLVVRLRLCSPQNGHDNDQQSPPPEPRDMDSPLGRWRELEVVMPISHTAPATLIQLPRWLPKWKQRFGLLLLDLGPMHLVPSRTIGRLCDSCYLLLGPDTCASQAWITRHVNWHRQSGSVICGSLVSQFVS